MVKPWEGMGMEALEQVMGAAEESKQKVLEIALETVAFLLEVKIA